MNQPAPYDVYGIGNAIVDTEYEVHDAFLEKAQLAKGMMTLIEPEQRRELILALQQNEHEVIKLAGGGSAANTIVVVAQLGGRSFYSCKVAADKTGDFFLGDLNALGIDTNMGSEREAGISGECISMVTPDAERTMTTCLGITSELSLKELSPDALRVSKYLYIEGYLVTSPPALEAVFAAQEIAREHNVKVALTLSDPAMVENFRDAFAEIVTRGVDLIFCNQAEALLWAQTESTEVAANFLKDSAPGFVMTQGAEGAVVFDGSQSLVPGVSTRAVDTTGAGDIFAGTFLHGITHGQDFTTAASRANKAASLLVSSFGARLSLDQVKANL